MKVFYILAVCRNIIFIVLCIVTATIAHTHAYQHIHVTVTRCIDNFVCVPMSFQCQPNITANCKHICAFIILLQRSCFEFSMPSFNINCFILLLLFTWRFFFSFFLSILPSLSCSLALSLYLVFVVVVVCFFRSWVNWWEFSLFILFLYTIIHFACAISMYFNTFCVYSFFALWLKFSFRVQSAIVLCREREREKIQQNEEICEIVNTEHWKHTHRVGGWFMKKWCKWNRQQW